MACDWLVLDMNNLAWRAFHTTGTLSHNDEPTGVMYGILRDLVTLRERFGNCGMVFCFDHGVGLREKACTWYKETRRKRVLTEDQERQHEEVQHQLTRLRQEWLESLGYRNVFFANGYEADDVMAAVSRNLPDGDRAILVSGDSDMYQLLSRTTAQYLPLTKHLYTAREFKKEYGINPDQWAEVKAIAGCGTDDVSGVGDVGTKTACQFLRGELKNTGKRYKDIIAFIKTPAYETNLKLVSIPYPGCPDFRPEPDPPPDPRAWDRLCESLGINSLLGASAGFVPIRRS